ncbi:MAG: tyrosine-type recombinase/integrase [Terriglobia bacterium]
MLTDVKLRNLKPRHRLYRVADSAGLAIEVRPNGVRYWRLRYRFADKSKMLSFGAYPEVTLAAARLKRDQARKSLRDGKDPSDVRRLSKLKAKATAANSFEAVAREWMARQHVAEKTAKKNRWLLETFAFPYLGRRPVAEITSRELLDVLRKVEARGKLETAQRLKQKCGQVFRYAILEGKAETDPTASLRGALRTPKTRHHATVTEPKAIGELLRAIDGFSGQYVTLAALKLAPLVFVRPGELRKAEWSEFDLDAAEWRIPAERMKMHAAHLVPLSTQAVAILRDLYPITSAGRYLFPSVRTHIRPMSENTINAALRRLGYGSTEMTGHGFRAMASSRLNEMGWNPDAIERQLAHAESNKVREAYAHAAQYLADRRRMMQAWADYLDGLKRGAKITPIHRRRTA